MLAAVFAMGVHSTFFGPIKYAILPQHLRKDEVLGGTGLVEAGTYIAILLGTILAGMLASCAGGRRAGRRRCSRCWAIPPGRQVPPAPPAAERIPFDRHIIRASVTLVNATMHIPRLFLAILSISFFWTIGAVLIIIFPPLVKNVLGANEQVASLFIAHLLGRDRDRFGADQPAAEERGFGALRTGVGDRDGRLRPAAAFRRADRGASIGPSSTTLGNFVFHPMAGLMIVALLGVAITGGMFVVPLYAFLTTTVPKTADGTDRRRQQHRQFGRDGGRLGWRLR